MIANLKLIVRNNFLFISGIFLILASYIIPAYYNMFLWDNIKTLIVYNSEALLDVYSLLLIPIVILFYLKRSYGYAFWLSYAILLFQMFAMAFRYIYNLFWDEYLVYVSGIIIVVVTFHRSVVLRHRLNVVLFVASCIFVLFLIMLTVFGSFDKIYFWILYILVSYMFFSLKDKLTYRLFNGMLLAFYFLAFLIMFFNLKCNIKAVLDVGYVDWSVNTIYTNCKSFMLATFVAIVFNYAIVKKSTEEFMNQESKNDSTIQ